MGCFKKLSKDRFGDPVDPEKRVKDPLGPGNCYPPNLGLYESMT